MKLARLLLYQFTEADSMFLLSWLLGCQHQYMVIPGAVTVADYDINVNEAAPPITWSVGTSALPTVLGDSVSVDLHLDPTWTFDTQEIVVVAFIDATTSYPVGWVYDLSPDERAAGGVSMELQLTDETPEDEVCLRSYTGAGTCYGEVDEGITTTSWLASSGDGGETSLGAPIPITLDPLVEETSTGACQTLEDCCGCTPDPDLGTNICPVECYETPECGCPAGASDRGDGPEGLRACVCPE